MGARRVFFWAALAALGCAVCSVVSRAQPSAQGREKRVTPVDAAQRATFERERKVGVAILVGIGKYPRYSGLGELRYPPRYADALESELSAQRYVVTTLKDGEATRGAILNAIRQSGEVIDAEHGTLLFFFSGHGFAEGNSNYLASYDATSNDLARGGLDLGAVEKAMVATGARRRVMWVDACRNEPGKGAGDGRTFSRFEGSSGTRILFSTKAGRISYEDDDLKQGLFSYYLAHGLHGEAARDDGMVSFRDLADFVVDGVESRSLKQGRVQVPYEAGESSGDFLLARSSASAKAPEPVRAPDPLRGPEPVHTSAASSVPPSSGQSSLEGTAWAPVWDLNFGNGDGVVSSKGLSKGKSVLHLNANGRWVLKRNDTVDNEGTWEQRGSTVVLDCPESPLQLGWHIEADLKGHTLEGTHRFFRGEVATSPAATPLHWRATSLK
jgi:hypothetical protein